MEPMRLRFLAVSSIIAVSIAAVITAAQYYDGKADRSKSEASFFYYTADELVLMRGGNTITRITQLHNFGNPEDTEVTWTSSGKYLVSFTQEPVPDTLDDQRYLTFTDIDTGESTKFLCEDCRSPVAIGGDTIAVLADSGSRFHYLKFEPDSDDDVGVVSFPVQERDLVNPSPMQILGPLGDSYLIGRISSVDHDHQSDFRLKLWLVDSARRRSTPIASGIDSGHFPVTAVPANPVTGVDRIAIAQSPHGNGCRTVHPVIVVDDLGNVHDTDMSAALPPGYEQGGQGGLAVYDLSWSPVDDKFHAEMMSWKCKTSDDNPYGQAETVYSRWKLDGYTGSSHFVGA